MPTAKLDQVAQNMIWEQHVKKEAKVLRLQTEFRLGDPHKSALALLRLPPCCGS